MTFNDHDGSTKSYSYVKDHEEPLGDLNFVPFFEDINIDYDPGTTTAVTLHNGSKLLLSKLAEDYNPTDKHRALRCCTRQRHATSSRPASSTSSQTSRTSSTCSASSTSRSRRSTPRASRPGKAALDEIMESFHGQTWVDCGRIGDDEYGSVAIYLGFIMAFALVSLAMAASCARTV